MPSNSDVPKPPSSRQWPPKGKPTMNALPSNGPPPLKWNPTTNSVHIHPEAGNGLLSPMSSQKMVAMGQPQENAIGASLIKGQSKALDKAPVVSDTTTATALSKPSGQRRTMPKQTHVVAEGATSSSSLHTKSSSKHGDAEYLRDISSKTRIGSFTWEDPIRSAATRAQTATLQKQKTDASLSKTNPTRR